MNFKLTTSMAAAALAASICSQAAAVPLATTAGQISYIGGTHVILDAGNATFVYSQGPNFDGEDPNTLLGGTVDAFNVTRLNVRGVQGSTVDEMALAEPYLLPIEMIRSGIAANLTVASHTIDGATGEVLSMNSSGGIEHIGTRVAGTVTGGAATLSNLRFDLANRLIYADLTGARPAFLTVPAATYNLPNTALWTIGTVAGPTVIDPAALALTGQTRIDAFTASGFTFDGVSRFSAPTAVSGLQLTQAGFDFFRDALGLQATGRAAFGTVNSSGGWGSATLNLSFTVQAVPEPGSYALAGVGLLVVWGARRARR